MLCYQHTHIILKKDVTTCNALPNPAPSAIFWPGSSDIYIYIYIYIYICRISLEVQAKVHLFTAFLK